MSSVIRASPTGRLYDMYIQERITLNWSASSCSTLIWTHGKKTLYQLDQAAPLYDTFEDISTAITERAKKRYGLYVSWELGWSNCYVDINDRFSHYIIWVVINLFFRFRNII